MTDLLLLAILAVLFPPILILYGIVGVFLLYLAIFK
jgi:hypothetical protein